MQMVYVSITGLRLKSPLYLPRFWWHATRAMAQAKAAEGNLRAEAKTVAGLHHTLSVWTDEAAMRAYLTAGAHRRALRAFPAMADGAVLGWETDQVPGWSDIPEIWRSRGRRV
ncbi:MAG: hypothetical protein Kilf2KO_34010 [Rhodospirillales bacterium]